MNPEDESSIFGPEDRSTGMPGNSIVAAKDAVHGEIYRSRAGHPIPTTYLMRTSDETVKRLAKKSPARSMSTSDIREIQMAKDALQGKAIMFTRYLRGTDFQGQHYEHRSYVVCPPDYELQRLKERPGYT